MTENKPDNDLETHLADFMAPADDQGFSDAVMRTLKAEEASVDLSDYLAQPSHPWRSWVIALTLGLISGLIWTWAGLSLPDIPAMDTHVALKDTDWALYAIAAACIAGSLIFVELDSA